MYHKRLQATAEWKRNNPDKVKKNNLNFYHAHKGKINEARREENAKERAADPNPRPPGRPRGPAPRLVQYPEEAREVIEANETLVPLYITGIITQGNNALKPPTINVPEWLPAKAKQALGIQVEIPVKPTLQYWYLLGDWWQVNSSKKEKGLKDETKKGYANKTRNTFIECFKMPSTVKGKDVYDVLPMVEWVIANKKGDDIWMLLKCMEDKSEKPGLLAAVPQSTHTAEDGCFQHCTCPFHNDA